MPIVFEMAPWEQLGDVLGQLRYRVIFGGFGALSNTWAEICGRKMQNPPKK